MITFKQVEAFHSVVRLGGIVKAAERLHTTESTVSKRLQEFEAALGMRVFERDGRSLVASAEGRQILLLCEKLLDTRADIFRLTKPTHKHGNVLRLGITELVASLYLKQLMEAIGAAFPGLQIDPTVDWNDILVQGLRDQMLDLIICPSLPMRAGEFNCTILTESRPTWICSPGLLPRGKVDSLAELAELPLLLQPNMSLFHEAIISFFHQHGLYPSRILTASNLSVLREFAIVGLGAAALPPAYCRAQLAAGELQIIETKFKPPTLQYAVFCNRTVTDPTIIKATDIVASIIGEGAFQ